MHKIEYVWREMLFQVIEKRQVHFSNIGLANKLNLSTSMVSHALKPLRELQIVKIGKFDSRIIDTEKLLFFWATRRNLNKDLIYQTYSPMPILGIEASMPQDVLPTAYSAYRLYIGYPPADYDKVYFYAQNPEIIKNRFPPVERKKPNIFILQADPFLSTYSKTPIAQIFTDLWNLPDWFAKEFTTGLLDHIRGKIGL